MFGFAIISHGFSNRQREIAEEIHDYTLRPLFLVKTDTLRSLAIRSKKLYQENTEVRAFVTPEKFFTTKGLVSDDAVDTLLKRAIDQLGGR